MSQSQLEVEKSVKNILHYMMPISRLKKAQDAEKKVKKLKFKRAFNKKYQEQLNKAIDEFGEAKDIESALYLKMADAAFDDYTKGTIKWSPDRWVFGAEGDNTILLIDQLENAKRYKINRNDMNKIIEKYKKKYER